MVCYRKRSRMRYLNLTLQLKALIHSVECVAAFVVISRFNLVTKLSTMVWMWGYNVKNWLVTAKKDLKNHRLWVHHLVPIETFVATSPSLVLVQDIHSSNSIKINVVLKTGNRKNSNRNCRKDVNMERTYVHISIVALLVIDPYS